MIDEHCEKADEPLNTRYFLQLETPSFKSLLKIFKMQIPSWLVLYKLKKDSP